MYVIIPAAVPVWAHGEHDLDGVAVPAGAGVQVTFPTQAVQMSTMSYSTNGAVHGEPGSVEVAPIWLQGRKGVCDMNGKMYQSERSPSSCTGSRPWGQ